MYLWVFETSKNWRPAQGVAVVKASTFETASALLKQECTKHNTYTACNVNESFTDEDSYGPFDWYVKSRLVLGSLYTQNETLSFLMSFE